MIYEKQKNNNGHYECTSDLSKEKLLTNTYYKDVQGKIYLKNVVFIENVL